VFAINTHELITKCNFTPYDSIDLVDRFGCSMWVVSFLLLGRALRMVLVKIDLTSTRSICE